MSSRKIQEQVNIAYDLKKTQHALRLAFDEGMRTIDLTTPQYAALSMIEAHRGISNAQLARKCFVTAQTMHGIMANLEKRALIKRTSNPSHGRVLCTELSAKGKKCLSEARLLTESIEGTMIRNIKKSDLILFKALLKQFMDNLS